MGASQYHEIHYIKVFYIEVWVYSIINLEKLTRNSWLNKISLILHRVDRTTGWSQCTTRSRMQICIQSLAISTPQKVYNCYTFERKGLNSCTLLCLEVSDSVMNSGIETFFNSIHFGYPHATGILFWNKRIGTSGNFESTGWNFIPLW